MGAFIQFVEQAEICRKDQRGAYRGQLEQKLGGLRIGIARCMELELIHADGGDSLLYRLCGGFLQALTLSIATSELAAKESLRADIRANCDMPRTGYGKVSVAWEDK